MNLIVREASELIAFVGSMLLRLLPFLAVSVPLSLWLRRSGLSTRITRALGSRPAVAILLATLAGAVSPLCSCGVVPMVAALLAGGVPLAPVMAFWLASPSMDPEIFFLSVASLGWDLAVWRLAATFVMSLGAGFATLALERRGFIGAQSLRGLAAKPPITAFEAVKNPGAAPSSRGTASLGLAPACAAIRAPSRLDALAFARLGPLDTAAAPALGLAGACCARSACACSTAAVDEAPQPRPAAGARPSRGGLAGFLERAQARLRAFTASQGGSLAADSLATALRLAALMSLAFVLEAVIIRYLPTGFAAGLLGRDSPFAVPLATLVGVPFYATELSALGLVSGLMAQGMSEPAGLAFLIGGGVTTIPAMAAVWGLVKPRVFALYLAFCAGGALLAGYSMQLVSSL